MNILVADEAWIATALLQHEHPDAEDFSLGEIRDRAQREFHDDRPGVWQHIVSHCVASNRPNPAQYRMLQQHSARSKEALSTGRSSTPRKEGEDSS